MRNNVCVVLALVFGVLFSGSVSAAPLVPDAGKITSTVRDTRPQQPPPDKGSIKVMPPASQPSVLQGEAKVKVNQFRLSGKIPFSAQELQGLLSDYTDRELSLSQLQSATEVLTNKLRKEGYIVATVILPAQEIKDGIVDLIVVVGEYGNIEIRNQSRLLTGIIESMVGNLKKEPFIRQQKLERSLLLLGDLGGIVSKAVLKPGNKPGTSDLVLEIKDLPSVTGSVGIDNYGSRYLGQTRYSGNISFRNPSRRGDELNFGYISAGDGLNDFRGSYQVPLSSGLKIGASYAQTHYLLGDVFSALNVYGLAQTSSLFASYPIVRSHGYNLVGRIGFDYKFLQDRQDSTHYAVDHNDQVFSIGLAGDRRDRDGDGITSFAVNLFSGNLKIQGEEAKLADDLYTKTAGGFAKGTLSIVRTKWINPRLQYNVSLMAQLASKNLNSSEKMSLGGAYGVRAYPQGEASGDDGLLFSGELRWSLPTSQLQLIAFFDGGTVKINKNPWDDSINRRSLFGAGIGVAWTKPNDYSIRLDYSWKLGSEISVSDPHSNGRFWLQGIKYF